MAEAENNLTVERKIPYSRVTKPHFNETAASFYAGTSEEVRLSGQIYASWPASLFPFSLYFRRAIFCAFFFILWGGVCTRYEHVIFEHILLLYCGTASTAQHSAITPHKAANQVRADQSATTQASRRRASTVLQYRKHSTAQCNRPAQSCEASAWGSECDNASKQTEFARASTCRAFVEHADFSKRTKKSKSTWPTKYTTTHTALV